MTYSGGVEAFQLTFPASTNRYYQMALFTNLLVEAALTNLGWGTPGVVVTNTPVYGAEFWALRALLTPP
jgi:hypothetical protein